MNGFQGEGKSSEEKGNVKNVDDQNISVELSEFGLGKRSNSGQMSTNKHGDNGKLMVKTWFECATIKQRENQ